MIIISSRLAVEGIKYCKTGNFRMQENFATFAKISCREIVVLYISFQPVFKFFKSDILGPCQALLVLKWFLTPCIFDHQLHVPFSISVIQKIQPGSYRIFIVFGSYGAPFVK